MSSPAIISGGKELEIGNGVGIRVKKPKRHGDQDRGQGHQRGIVFGDHETDKGYDETWKHCALFPHNI